jgi:hypothetical protein
MKKTFTGVDGTVGAISAWESNDENGSWRAGNQKKLLKGNVLILNCVLRSDGGHRGCLYYWQKFTSTTETVKWGLMGYGLSYESNVTFFQMDKSWEWFTNGLDKDDFENSIRSFWQMKNRNSTKVAVSFDILLFFFIYSLNMPEHFFNPFIDIWNISFYEFSRIFHTTLYLSETVSIYSSYLEVALQTLKAVLNQPTTQIPLIIVLFFSLSWRLDNLLNKNRRRIRCMNFIN